MQNCNIINQNLVQDKINPNSITCSHNEFILPTNDTYKNKPTFSSYTEHIKKKLDTQVTFIRNTCEILKGASQTNVTAYNQFEIEDQSKRLREKEHLRSLQQLDDFNKYVEQFYELLNKQEETNTFANQNYLINALAFINLLKGDQKMINGQYNECLQYYEKSMNLWKSIFGENHSYHAICLSTIARLHYHLGDYSQALALFEKSLNIRQKIFDELHKDIAYSYNSIGCLYELKGDFKKALRYHQRALVIRIHLYGEFNEDSASSLNNIGCIYLKAGDFQQALQNFHKSLSIRNKLFGDSHQDILQSYGNIAKLYIKKQSYKLALSYQQQILNIRKKYFPNDYHALISVYFEIAATYMKLKEYKNAADNFLNCVQIKQLYFYRNEQLEGIEGNDNKSNSNQSMKNQSVEIGDFFGCLGESIENNADFLLAYKHYKKTLLTYLQSQAKEKKSKDDISFIRVLIKSLEVKQAKFNIEQKV